MNTPSLSKYYEKIDERALNPLNSGLYKLNEINELLEEYLAELSRIEAYKRTRRADVATMLHCTPSDAQVWIREIPNLIIEVMGYDVLPSITALKGDSVPHSLTISLSERYAPQILSLVKQCASRINNQKYQLQEAHRITQSILTTLWILGYDFDD